MRILIVGGDGPLLRILAARFSIADQAVALMRDFVAAQIAASYAAT